MEDHSGGMHITLLLLRGMGGFVALDLGARRAAGPGPVVPGERALARLDGLEDRHGAGAVGGQLGVLVGRFIVTRHGCFCFRFCSCPCFLFLGFCFCRCCCLSFFFSVLFFSCVEVDLRGLRANQEGIYKFGKAAPQLIMNRLRSVTVSRSPTVCDSREAFVILWGNSVINSKT
ncbi:hypothetical protein F4809DRAFT_225114 [Biscogniauxia mediterranea]|nr:hypothetical protein F4809DRAFT_225114 [Biscogniauxia mediterranea]